METTALPSGGPKWTLGDYLHKARREARISSAAMALRFGVTRKTINNWEADRTRPSPVEAEVWAQVTGAEWLRDLLIDSSRWMWFFAGQDELPFGQVLADAPVHVTAA